jgi:hypothetical protein
MTRTKTLLFLACFFLAGCKDKAQKAEDVIRMNLQPGATAAEVESCLKKLNCGYSYDKETKKYTAILRDVGLEKVAAKKMLIIIKMDESNKMKNLDFLVYYKGP